MCKIVLKMFSVECIMDEDVWIWDRDEWRLFKGKDAITKRKILSIVVKGRRVEELIKFERKEKYNEF